MKKEKLPRLFFFTGLGADERAFTFLNIKTTYEKIYVSWLSPEKGENIANYAKRLIEEYKITDGDILIGLSFGGFVACEISKKITPSLNILISSVSTKYELPYFYRFAGFLHLDCFIPDKWFTKSGKLKYFLFGLKKPEQRQLFDEIITHSDIKFTKWAIAQIIRWKNTYRPENTYKISGTKDRILPPHFPTVDFVIAGGSHFLTWEKAKEVSKIINLLLSKTNSK